MLRSFFFTTLNVFSVPSRTSQSLWISIVRHKIVPHGLTDGTPVDIPDRVENSCVKQRGNRSEMKERTCELRYPASMTRSSQLEAFYAPAIQ